MFKIISSLLISLAITACGHGGVSGPSGAGGGGPGGNGGVGGVGNGTVAGAGTYMIAGLVSGAATGVTTVTLTPASGVATTVNTNVNGLYSFPMPTLGNYSITPKNPNYSFTPAASTISVTPSTTGQSGINFLATTAYSVSGSITGAVISGIKIWLYNTGSAAPISTLSDANGYFQFTGLATGTYTATPSLSGYSFSPANNVITLTNASITANNYVATAGGTTTTTTATVSGTVTGAVGSGVAITLYGTKSATPISTVTDINGFYLIPGLSNDTYTIIPSMSGYTFSPLNTNVTITGGNITANNYVSLAAATSTTTYILSGMVTGSAIKGVTVYLYGPAGQQTAISDANGFYQFAGLLSGGYTIVPNLAGYSFNPANKIITVGTANSPGNGFISTAISKNNLSGLVTGVVVNGLTINLYGNTTTTTTSTTTDVNGFYQFSALPDGTYTVVPSMAGLAFSPTSLVVNVAGAPSTANDFVAASTSFNIGGTVTGMPGVVINLGGPTSSTTTTDSLGHYNFLQLSSGQYTVTPSFSGYTFSPTSSTITLSSTNATGVNFTPTKIVIPTYTITGNITSPAGLAGTTVTLGGTSAATTQTDALGNYSFTGLIAGTYVVTPTLPAALHIEFTPALANIALNTNTTVNFIGSSIFNIIISADTADLNVGAALVGAGWNGISQVKGIVTVTSGVTVYASTTANYAMTLPSLPTGSQIVLNNNGTIVGAGGSSGLPGGPAMNIMPTSTSINTINNYGVIGGGGGGGGIGTLVGTGSYPGGTGAGLLAATAGTIGPGSPWPGGGTAYGGNGGGLGVAGAQGTNVWCNPGVNCAWNYTAGAAPGAATTGYVNANWLVLGTFYGAKN